MKKILLAAAALGMLGIGAPPAMADDSYQGGCSFSSVSPPDSNDTFTGEIDLVAVATNSTGPAGATFTCVLYVNGGEVGRLGPVDTVDPTGVAVGAAPVSYVAPEGSTTQLCTTVTYDNGHPGSTDCGDASEFEVPPQVVIDLLIMVIEAIEDATYIPDPVLCPILAGLEGTYLDGLLVIDDEGDVYFPAPEKFWDCPPYDPPLA